MANPTPRQVALRDRFEALIGLAAPLLDGVLVLGDRVSHIVGSDDEYYPVRPPGEAFELIPSVRPALHAGGERGERDSTGDAE